MVRRSGGSITRRLTAATAMVVVLAACSSSAGGTPSTVSGALGTSPSSTISTSSTPPSSDPATSTTRTVPIQRAASIDPEIIVPAGVGPFPAVVLVHGGGWVAGDPSIMRPLARWISEEAFLTINTNYTLAGDGAAFPAAVDDIACAVRMAQSHPDSDGTVAIVGHSAGAHLAAIVALAGDQYGAGCPFEGSGIPDRLVGLAGPYDVGRLGFLMIPFFGGGPQVAPEAWLAGNPHNLVEQNPALSTLLLHGDGDGIVDISFSFDFADALESAGSEVLVEVVEGAAHEDLRDPEVVGDLIVTWLLR